MTDPTLKTGTEPLTQGQPQAVALKIVVVSGPDFGATLALDRGTYRIGKDPENDLPLSDPAVSRIHLLAQVTRGGVRLTDQNSRNGTFLEGARFTAVEVGPGTIIRLGRSALKILPASVQAPALPPSDRQQFGGLTGRALVMRQVFAQLERIASAEADVLITGETGSGKELCARALHAAGRRASAPFVVCDVARLSSAGLAESELFGHARGAFTGAQTSRAGVFELADGGTLFLDEIGELPLELQPLLLRALEQREIKRLGASAPRTVNLRVIAATHRDLVRDVQRGTFRADLFHRLSVTQVTLPPLRDRPEDIELLVDELLARMALAPQLVSPSTRALLRGYDWPGNIRELRNVVERVVSLGEAGLPPGIRPVPAADDAPSGPLPFKEAKQRLLSDFERDYLIDLMARCEGNVTHAAREAGIDRVHLHKLVKKHGLGQP